MTYRGQLRGAFAMWANIPAIVRIDGMPSQDGHSVLVRGKLETGAEIAFGLELSLG
jgi:hypothetical protein